MPAKKGAEVVRHTLLEESCRNGIYRLYHGEITYFEAIHRIFVNFADFLKKKEKEIVVGKIELSELILISKIDSSELALLAMLLESQSNPSYSPSPEVAHVL